MIINHVTYYFYICFVVVNDRSIQRPARVISRVLVDYVIAVTSNSTNYMSDNFSVMGKNISFKDFFSVLVFQPGILPYGI